MPEEVSGVATHVRRLTMIKKRDWITRWLDDESNIDIMAGKSIVHSSPKNRHSLPILGSFKTKNLAQRDINPNSMEGNSPWAVKFQNVKQRREALEKRKVQQKLDNIREKKIRINAFKEKIKPRRYNGDG